MARQSRVIVGFDASEQARDALQLGSELAKAEGAELHVAVVLPRGEAPFEEALFGGRLAEQVDQQLFDEVARELDGMSFIPAHLNGALGGRSAARALYEYARDEGADLIVVGSTHRGKLGRVLPGSVGESLLRGAPCGVAVAPRGFARREHLPIGLIGVAYDGSDEANLALAKAERLAAVLGAELRVITVVPDLAPLSAQGPQVEAIHESLRREYGDLLEKGVSALSARTTAEAALKEGDPATVLADQGVELDLIVVGSRGYGPMRQALLGAVSAEVMRTAPCPVLVIPRSSAGAESPDAAAAAAANA